MLVGCSIKRRYHGCDEFFNDLQSFKHNVQIGDKITINQDDIAFERECMLPEYLTFTVTEKYPHHLVMEKITWKGKTHRQSIDYIKLMMLINKDKCIYSRCDIDD